VGERVRGRKGRKGKRERSRGRGMEVRGTCCSDVTIFGSRFVDRDSLPSNEQYC